MTKSWFDGVMAPGKNCSDDKCSETCFSLAKVVFWSAFFSLFIVAPRLWDCYKRSLESDPGIVGILDTGIMLWLAVWIATIALTAHEKMNHFLTLMINSMSLPGFVIGITALVGSGA
ncbi:hypothetical protein [Roseobacter weihaiensis]|uniref:hypothetical protein n=1 Tax=Roseobacter weihaiensis TaxID=2763262 RepID=UPI001D0BB6CF|nr:hypothetical protein [Roseobacter sp. H9]